MSLPYGGLSETIRGGLNINQGMSGAFSTKDQPTRIVRHTERLVSERICAGAQPFSDRHGEGQGGFPEPLSEVGTTPPWITPGKKRGPSPSE